MYEEEVARGAELLDEKAPGWEGKINLEDLEMASCVRCVLGQMYGHYDDGKEALGLFTGSVHGFDIQWPVSVYWDQLRDTWISLIKTRYDTGTLSDMDQT